MTDKFYDGFWLKLNNHVSGWDENFNENVFYLHGGMHIFDDDKASLAVLKIICAKAGDYLLDRIRERIDNSQFPLYVAEGDHGSKFEKIRRNIYLRYCYEKLSSSEGVMFTYGVSFNNDDHILDAIRKSKISKLFVGIIDGHDAASVKARKFLLGKSIEIFEYDVFTAKVWRNEDSNDST